MKQILINIVHLVTAMLLVFSAKSQSVNGDKIQVSAQTMTILKFKSTITRYEFGNRGMYTCTINDADNSITIKTSDSHATNTNLLVTEGKRVHHFNIEFIKKVDFNKTDLTYNYSNLKQLKKHVVEQEKLKEAQAKEAIEKEELQKKQNEQFAIMEQRKQDSIKQLKNSKNIKTKPNKEGKNKVTVVNKKSSTMIEKVNTKTALPPLKDTQQNSSPKIKSKKNTTIKNTVNQ